MKIGQKFGRLTILKEVKPHILPCGQRKRKVLCQCECGNTKEILYYRLKNGHTRSCGCLRKEKMTKHGMSTVRIYVIWKNIKQRCNNKKCRDYKNYGGRGIIICKEWFIFENFKDDMYKSYLEHRKNNNYTSIDRIDNNLGYYKENCRWATYKEQNNNKRKKYVRYKTEKIRAISRKTRRAI